LSGGSVARYSLVFPTSSAISLYYTRVFTNYFFGDSKTIFGGSKTNVAFSLIGEN
jgi:hypothetical protein